MLTVHENNFGIRPIVNVISLLLSFKYKLKSTLRYFLDEKNCILSFSKDNNQLEFSFY